MFILFLMIDSVVGMWYFFYMFCSSILLEYLGLGNLVCEVKLLLFMCMSMSWWLFLEVILGIGMFGSVSVWCRNLIGWMI